VRVRQPGPHGLAACPPGLADPCCCRKPGVAAAVALAAKKGGSGGDGKAAKDDAGEAGGGLMPPAELRAALKKADTRGRPSSCVVGFTRDKRAVILVDHLPKPRKLLAQVKAQGQAAGLDLDVPSLRFGRVSVSGRQVDITVNKAVAPALELKLKPVMRGAGHPVFTINADPDIEDEPEDGADQDSAGAVPAHPVPGQVQNPGMPSAASPSPTPGPAAPAAAAAAPADGNKAAGNEAVGDGAAAPRASLLGVVPPDLVRGIQVAVAADPSRKPALARLLAGVRAGVDTGDSRTAEAGITALRQAVDGPAPQSAKEDRTARGQAAGAGQVASASAALAEGPRPMQADAKLADLARAWDAEQAKTGQGSAALQGGPKAPAPPASKRGTAPALTGEGEDLMMPALSRTPWAPPEAQPAPPAESLPAPRPLPGPIGTSPGVRPPGTVPPVNVPPGPLTRALPAMRMIGGIAVVVVAGTLANQLNSANFDSQIVDALKRFGLDPSKPADVKAAQAYVFMRLLAPQRQQFYSVPALLDPRSRQVQEAVMRAVQADPDLLDRALEHDQGATDKLEGVIQGALGGTGGTAPAPGQAAPHGAGQDRPGTPGLPQQPAPGQGPRQPAWLKEIEGD